MPAVGAALFGLRPVAVVHDFSSVGSDVLWVTWTRSPPVLWLNPMAQNALSAQVIVLLCPHGVCLPQITSKILLVA